MPISAVQRAWLDDLAQIVGSPAIEDEEQTDAPSQGVGRGPAKRGGAAKPALDDDLETLVADGTDPVGAADKGSGEQRFGFGPEDILPVIPGLIDEATQRRATCAIHNNTQQVLKLDTASLDETEDDSGKTPGIRHGKYVVFPPSKIGPDDQSGRFVAENNKVLIFSTTGAEGFVRYTLDAQGTAWVFHFNNPFGATGEKNSADARVEGPNAASFETPRPGMSGKSDVKYLFILNAKGGSGPEPKPEPKPTPNAEIRSSCQITVNNNTKAPLTFLDAKHERGNFMTPVPTTVAPGTSITFASVETPNAKEQGCKGFIIWQVGTTPQDPVWLIQWDNPEGEKNTSEAEVTPPTAFKSIDQIGQGDENVPVVFTISGEGGGTGPVPPVPVPPEPDLPFDPPVKTKQPTFRINDKSKDGWIEYAQFLLNFHLGTKLKIDGVFGQATQAAILRFQKDKKLQVDGTLGNQTWAALRDGAPEKPSTDGRTPHTFVETGVEARWSVESNTFNFHDAIKDEVLLSVNSVGDTALDPSTEATIRVTPPGGKPKVVKAALGAGFPTPSGDGAFHTVTIKDFRKRFPSVPLDAPVAGYLLEGFLPAELGGDFFSGNAQEI